MHGPRLEIKYEKVDALIPYILNPRVHSPDQIARVAASIVEVGFTNPILIDGSNGVMRISRHRDR
jgi:ParB-like chromosome segregation protein Spo0J